MRSVMGLAALMLLGCGGEQIGGEQDMGGQSSEEPSNEVDPGAQAEEVPQDRPVEGCSIEGEWTMTSYPGMNDVGPGGERPLGLTREYTFRDGRFRMNGYPPLVIEGAYAVAGRTGATLRLALTEVVFDGEPSGDEAREVTFVSCDEMQMQGASYRRRAP